MANRNTQNWRQMAGNGRLTARQEQAILGLLTEPTIQAAATSAHIGERTLFRWLQDPVFQEAYQTTRREAVSQAMSRLSQVASKAVEALEAVITDAQAPPAARVSAAKVVLEQVRAERLEDLEQRYTALAARMEELSERTEAENRYQ